tara:strand:- start:374 stop:532 length:159 start_codon:yes stop_codon:yes gene_type:complete
MKEYQEKNVDKLVVVVKKEKLNEEVEKVEEEEVIVYLLKENIGKDEKVEKAK